jgi:hypothetical protein
MKARALLILLVLVVAMAPVYFFNRWLQRMIKPRENVGRLFIFVLANFVIVVVYTMLVVGMIVRIFPIR